MVTAGSMVKTRESGAMVLKNEAVGLGGQMNNDQGEGPSTSYR